MEFRMDNYSKWMSYEDFRGLCYPLLSWLCQPTAPIWNQVKVEVYRPSSRGMAPKPQFIIPDFAIWDLKLEDLQPCLAHFHVTDLSLLQFRFIVL